MELVQSTSWWRDGWDHFEAKVGLIAAFVLAYGPLTVAGFTLIFSLILAEWSVALIAAITTAVTLPMAVWLTRMAESALTQFCSGSPPLYAREFSSVTVPIIEPQRRPSFAMLLADELPPLPLFARVPLAIWWFAHFVAGTALVEFADVLAQDGLLWEGFADGAGAVVFGYLFHFAANVYLVLAVTVCFASPALTAGVWRRRFAIDALFTFPLLLRIVL